jgi:hypothetical protein
MALVKSLHIPNQCCGSGCLSRIPDPDFYIHPGSRITDPGSRIPDPGSKNATRERGEKIVVIPFFIATNFTKLKII